MNMVAGSTTSAICAVSVMNCSCTHDEQILAGKALLDHLLLGRDRHRIGVLDEHRRHRRRRLSTPRASPVRMRADPRLVEHARDADRSRRAPSIRVLLNYRSRRCCGTRRRLRAARRRSPPGCTAPHASGPRRCASARSRSRAGRRCAWSRRQRGKGLDLLDRQPVIAEAHSGVARLADALRVRAAQSV